MAMAGNEAIRALRKTGPAPEEKIFRVMPCVKIKNSSTMGDFKINISTIIRAIMDNESVRCMNVNYYTQLMSIAIIGMISHLFGRFLDD